MTLSNIVHKIKEYGVIPSVVGYEGPFLNHLKKEYGSSVVFKSDQLLVVKGGNSPSIISAHIDRHGIVCNELGFFEFAGIHRKKIIGTSGATKEFMEGFGRKYKDYDVFSYNDKGKVLDKGRVISFTSDVENKNLYFGIEGIKHRENTPIALDTNIRMYGGRVRGQIDNVISAAVISELFSNGFEGTAIFSTDEEIGESWRHIGDYLGNCNKLIVLDTSPFSTDIPLEEGRVVLRNSDNYGVFNPEITQSVKSVCKKNGIPYITKDLFMKRKGKSIGECEMGVLVKFTNVTGTTIQVPTINYHTNNETTSNKALRNYYKCLELILQ